MEKTELQKQAKSHEKQWLIREFVSFLYEKHKCFIGKYETHCPLCGAEVTELINKFFDIDAEKLENERRELLKNFKEKINES